MFLSRAMHGQEEAGGGGRRRRRGRRRKEEEEGEEEENYSGTGDKGGQYAFVLYNRTVLQNKMMEVVIFFSFDCNN